MQFLHLHNSLVATGKRLGLDHFATQLLTACFGVAFLLVPAFLSAQASACASGPPAPNAQCTPPTTFNVSVVATGTHNWQTLTGVSPDNVTGKIKITGSGTVTVPNGDLLLNSSNAVIYLDGPTLIINNGNLQLTTTGSRFIMNGGTLRTFGNFQQTTETVVCITGATLEIGEEQAGGLFNTNGNNNSAANWQNDGGYRYLKNDCINVTQDFQLQSTGSGTGISGVDVIIECCIEIGDRGLNHATPTAFSNADGDDSGNWQNSNRQQIYNTDIVVANGNFQTSIGTMTLCDVDVKVNKTGSFQVNSGTLDGQNVCAAVEDIFENSGTWTATVEHWYSEFQNSTNVPNAGSETAKATILTNCFGACSCTAATCTISALTATPGTCSNNLYDLTGSITFANAPTTGTLTVSIAGGGSQVFNAPFTSPQTYNITGQTADGASHTVTAVFSASGACTLNQTYTAPAACPTCTISALTATPGTCSNNLYDLSGSVTFANAPTTGALTVSITGGGSQVFNAPFTSPQAYSIAGQTADGASHTVTAVFSASGACTLNQTYTAPAACNTPTPKIGVAKAVTNLTNNNDGTYSVTYDLRVVNYGTVELFDLSLTDNLSTEFGTNVATASEVDAAGEYAVTSAPSIVSTTGGATLSTANTAFTGASDENILTPQPGQSMPTFSTALIRFTIKFYPVAGKTAYPNQATASGDSTENGTPDGETTDLSDDGACLGTSANPTSNAGSVIRPEPDIDCDGNPNEAGENDPTYFHITPPAASCPANAGVITY